MLSDNPIACVEATSGRRIRVSANLPRWRAPTRAERGWNPAADAASSAGAPAFFRWSARSHLRGLATPPIGVAATLVRERSRQPLRFARTRVGVATRREADRFASWATPTDNRPGNVETRSGTPRGRLSVPPASSSFWLVPLCYHVAIAERHASKSRCSGSWRYGWSHI